MLSQTGLEIRMFVQSFVSARNKASPLHNQPRQVLPTWNPESQEKYKKLYLERDNVELLSEEAVASAVDRISKQMTVPRVRWANSSYPTFPHWLRSEPQCVLDKPITPTAYRLVCEHLGDSEHGQTHESYTSVTDEWIECWVGCVNMLVQNGNKYWSWYMKLG
ncbi:hypothetical protein EV401DRAFT_672499 [Pisolithus croceorrhizus]|nr:hypothetical protein EV401DRAFT_672499 [Pisolithus croceorrhizus]